MENYKRTEILGQGAYGKVYKGQDLRTGQIVALKKALASTEEEGIPPTSLREISILKSISECEFIVKLLDIVNTKTKSGKGILYIVFQYLDFDLKAFMVSTKGKGNGLSNKISKEFCFQLLIGIKYCHKKGIMHRDLKPQNLLIENGSKLKIADFGLSRNFSIPIGKFTHEVVTLWYRSPEILLGAKCYSTPIDLWSIGCILAEMLSGRPCFCGESEFEQLLGIFRILGTPDTKNWPCISEFRDWHDFPKWFPEKLEKVFPNLEPDAINILKSFLRLDPMKRITANRAIDLPFFDEIRDFYNI
jgi:cyclin-dependent kinase